MYMKGSEDFFSGEGHLGAGTSGGEGTSSPKLPLPPSSPVPSISSGGSSKFSDYFSSQANASSSAPAAELNQFVVASPQISQGENNNQLPVINAPLSPPLPHDPNDPDYEEVDRISEACTQVQNDIVAGATILLQQRGININPDDIRRAVDMAMSEDWEVPIEVRIEHFRRLRGHLNARLLPRIMRELLSLGITNVPDPDQNH